MIDAYLSIGNSKSALTVIKGNECLSASLTADMNSLISDNNINRIFIVSVNNENKEVCLRNIQYTGQCVELFKIDNAVISKYSIEQMGIDRFMCIYNAQKSHIFPSVIADLGTADTYDYIDEKGIHIGGLIMPGLQTLHRGIAQFAEQIPLYEPQYRDILAGKNTEEAVTQGIYSQWLSGVINAVALTKEISPAYTAIITGGNSRRVHDFIKGLYDKHFLARGMKLYAENIYDA